MTIPERLLAVLVCPKCRGDLEHRPHEASLICHHCRLRYAIRDGIPIMLIDDAQPLT